MLVLSDVFSSFGAVAVWLNMMQRLEFEDPYITQTGLNSVGSQAAVLLLCHGIDQHNPA